MKVFGWVLLGIVLLSLLIGGTWAYRYYTAPIRGKVTAEEKIQSGQNRIQKYNHFFDLCARVQEVEDKIKSQKELLNDLEDKDSINRAQVRLSALKGERSRAARKYNQDARKEYTAGQFRSSKLPYQINTTIPQGGTVCSVN